MNYSRHYFERQCSGLISVGREGRQRRKMLRNTQCWAGWISTAWGKPYKHLSYTFKWQIAAVLWQNTLEYPHVLYQQLTKELHFCSFSWGLATKSSHLSCFFSSLYKHLGWILCTCKFYAGRALWDICLLTWVVTRSRISPLTFVTCLFCLNHLPSKTIERL